MITTIGTMSVAASMVILFAGYFLLTPPDAREGLGAQLRRHDLAAFDDQFVVEP